MASLRQKCGDCGHLMAGFDNHSFCSRCRDKRKGNILTRITSSPSQVIGLRRRSVRPKNGTVFIPTKDTQVDLASVLVIWAVDGQGTLQSPGFCGPEVKKPIKFRKSSPQAPKPSCTHASLSSRSQTADRPKPQ